MPSKAEQEGIEDGHAGYLHLLRPETQRRLKELLERKVQAAQGKSKLAKRKPCNIQQ